MEHLNSISEIIGTLDDPKGQVQVCATADTFYQAAEEKVVVELGALARHVTASGGDGSPVPEPWLPKGQRVSEHLPRGEATDFTKDVFHGWVKTVREAVPGRMHVL